jgi:hypothetical protein
MGYELETETGGLLHRTLASTFMLTITVGDCELFWQGVSLLGPMWSPS